MLTLDATVAANAAAAIASHNEIFLPDSRAIALCTYTPEVPAALRSGLCRSRGAPLAAHPSDNCTVAAASQQTTQPYVTDQFPQRRPSTRRAAAFTREFRR
jgi:hypothetical protein